MSHLWDTRQHGCCALPGVWDRSLGAGKESATRSIKGVQGSRMPEITLSLPAVLGLLVLFLTTGAVLVYLALNSSAAPAAEVTVTPTITLTPVTDR